MPKIEAAESENASKTCGVDCRPACLPPGRLATCPTFYNNRMLHIALYEPEIPPNTGNIARLCAATGAELHLIGRLGFRLDSRSLKRAGLDYWPLVRVHRHVTAEDFEQALGRARVFCLTAHAAKLYTQVRFQDG